MQDKGLLIFSLLFLLWPLTVSISQLRKGLGLLSYENEQKQKEYEKWVILYGTDQVIICGFVVLVLIFLIMFILAYLLFGIKIEFEETSSALVVVILLIAYLVYAVMDTFKALGYYSYAHKEAQKEYEEWVLEKGTFRVIQNGVIILVALSFLVALVLKQLS